MKGRSIVSVVSLIMVFVLMGTGTGCSESDSNSAESMMKDIPVGVHSFSYCDLKVMRGDGDLEDIYNDIKDEYNTELGIYNIDFDDVNYIADCEGKELAIFRGEFDLGDIRNALGDSDYSETDYSEEEVWLGDGGDTMVALFENLVVIGDEEDVSECIDVIKGKADSLLDSDDAKDLVDKVSSGLATYYQTRRAGESFGLGGSHELDNYQAYSASIKKKNGDTVSMTMVFEFDDADEAENTLDEIEEMFEEDSEEVIYYKNFNVNQDGRFVVISGEVDIEDMV